jgi:lipoprotein-releasing system permease protein
MRVALRFLREGRMQTLLIIVGVAAGVAVIAYISALISGLQATRSTRRWARRRTSACARRTTWSRLPPCRSARQHLLTETQPRAQRLRSVANWQALVPLLERMPAMARCRPWCRAAAWPCAARPRRPSHCGRGTGPLRPHRGPARQGGQRQRAPGARRGHSGPRAGGRPGRARGRPPDGADRRGERLRARDRAGGPGRAELNRRTVIVPLRAAQNLLGLPGGATNST